ncbi:hypothetical protein EMA8858_02434 [Emticicia aquatica]|jgi:hypothetical protein|uniref:Uncharacterized protein n=1 Tax=Emticicia aquatica TaxID=1681835 RepID=A0ABN8EX17_9BACT|nr:hypothetical protein EMA8858_02434 [Emticicia aquatica]
MFHSGKTLYHLHFLEFDVAIYTIFVEKRPQNVE